MDRLRFLEDLSLRSVDAMRHLVTSEDVVAAIAFAVRAGHSNVTAYRFVSALAMSDDLDYQPAWPRVLRKIIQLEDFDRLNREALQAGVEAQRKILEGES